MFSHARESAPNDAARLAFPVVALSAGLLGFEISLMRVLLYASWHHFAFLVISAALLGFGASGTALCFTRRWLVARGDSAIFALILAAAVSLPVATQIAQHIPVEARFVPALLARHIAWWILYWGILFVPFFLGASAIGLALMVAGDRLPTIYAFNLAGSAAGACIAPLAMHVVPPAWLAAMMGAITLAGILPMRILRTRKGAFAAVAATVATCAFLWFSPPQIRTDPFKYVSYVDDLVKDGRAIEVARLYGARATVEVYAGEAFHELAFLSPDGTPPPMLAVTLDGHWAGSVLRVRNAAAAGVVDHTMMSVPYAVAPAEPDVLLLGETGGANVWLAERRGARAIDVVQPNGQITRLFRGTLRDEGGVVFERRGVRVVNEEPRHFVDHTDARYDLIQLVTLESWAVATGGVGGLQQDNLVTVEGLEACLERLAPNGIVSVCRAIESPPRDNAKILTTLIEALKRSGAARPAEHIAVVRDFIAVCTMVKASPWTLDEIEKIRALCAERQLTPVYFTGIRDDELNHPDRLPGPSGERGDWLHHVAVTLFSGDANALIDGWPFDIRPPTDDRPFFENFGKLKSIRLLRETFGDLWLTRTELAFLFVLGVMVIIALSGAIMTVAPLGFQREIRRAPGRGGAALYFAAIGSGYIIMEITLLSRLIHLIGDPILAGAVTIAGFLFFSGLGSLFAQRIDPSRVSFIRRLIVVLVAAGAIVLVVSGPVVFLAGAFALPIRLAVAGLLIAPIAFLMGFPMASGLRQLESAAPPLVPWAWGVNGFASVLAPPLATAIGMSAGFRTAGVIALVLYSLAAIAFGALPRRGATSCVSDVRSARRNRSPCRR